MEEIDILFAVEAEHLILNEFYDEAISLLKKGIEKYPEYPVAYGILAKAYEQTGDKKNAVFYVDTALDLFPNNQPLQNYKNRLEQETAEEFIEESSPVTEDNFTEDNIDEKYLIDEKEDREELTEDIDELNDEVEELVENEEELTEEKEAPQRIFLPQGFLKEFIIYDKSINFSRPNMSSNLDLIPGFEFLKEKIESFEAQLSSVPILSTDIAPEELEQMDSKAKEFAEMSRGLSFITPPLEESILDPDSGDTLELETDDDYDFAETDFGQTGTVIATETMAKIYEQQGAYDKAISVYKQLIESIPDKAEDFQAKITILSAY